jgi:hypothetical protein
MPLNTCIWCGLVGINMFVNACIFLGSNSFPSFGNYESQDHLWKLFLVCSQKIPKLFPSSTQNVSHKLPMCSQRHSQYLAPHFLNPILFGHDSTSMDITCKRGTKGKHDKTCFYFGEENFYVGGATCFKNICDRPIKWLLLKKLKVPPLTNE